MYLLNIKCVILKIQNSKHILNIYVYVHIGERRAGGRVSEKKKCGKIICT